MAWTMNPDTPHFDDDLTRLHAWLFPDVYHLTTPARALTLGQLTENLERSGNHGVLGHYARKLIELEETVAYHAYWKAAGISDEESQCSDAERKRVIDDLTQTYIEVKLATGPKHAAEIIRNIQSQGAALAVNLPPH
jgi:hypothetical protein